MSSMAEDMYYFDTTDKTLITILALKRCFDKESALRFKELQTQLEKYGVKISTPTFIKHLEGLRRLKVVSRVNRGKGNIGYYLTDKYAEPAEMAKSMEWFRDRIKIMEKLPMKDSAMLMMSLFSYRDMKLVRMLLQRHFEPMMEKRLRIASDFLTALYHDHLVVFMESIQGKEKEYDETIEYLDEQIAKYGDLLFTKQP
jgi:hypothetical protein